MKEQLKFVEMLTLDLVKNMRKHMEIEEENGIRFRNDNFMSKNHGKCALKRKITILRQELLNLERMIGDVY